MTNKAIATTGLLTLLAFAIFVNRDNPLHVVATLGVFASCLFLGMIFKEIVKAQEGPPRTKPLTSEEVLIVVVVLGVPALILITSLVILSH